MEKLKKITGNYIQIVLYAYLLLIVVVFPLYAPRGYIEIGVNKYQFFKVAGLLCGVIVFPAVMIVLFAALKDFKRIRLSLTDKSMIFYGLAVILSFFCSEWREEALWGADGWYMGLVSQLMFLVIYFAVSRFGKNTGIWYGIFLLVSSVVFLLGILNRFSVYPIEMEGAVPGFISTLGNINWFCSYWMVVFPIGFVLYWLGGEYALWKRVLLGCYVILGFMTGVTQGSSSGFLALGTVFAVLFFLSLDSTEKLLRWLELAALFAAGLLALGVIQDCFPEALNYENALESWLTKYMTAFVLFAAAVVVYVAARYWFEKKDGRIETIKWVRWGAAAVLALAALASGFLLVYYNCFPGTDQSSPGGLLFTINETWGNGRGTTWSAGVKSFLAMPAKDKVIGVGPDCFYLCAYGNGDIAEMLYRVFGDARLTNAHNEWLTVLVNTGILGLVPYAAVFLSAVYRQFKYGKKQELLLVSAVCILTYTVHNMISFQQVICTPVVFILMGFGEGVIRSHPDRG